MKIERLYVTYTFDRIEKKKEEEIFDQINFIKLNSKKETHYVVYEKIILINIIKQ